MHVEELQIFISEFWFTDWNEGTWTYICNLCIKGTSSNNQGRQYRSLALFHSVLYENVLKMPCSYLEVSYKKIIPFSLSKCPQQSALAERSYSSALRAQDGQLLCGWILGTREVGRHQGIWMQEVSFPGEESGEPRLQPAEAGR